MNQNFVNIYGRSSLRGTVGKKENNNIITTDCSNQPSINACKKKKLFIILGVILTLVVVVVIIICILLLRKKPNVKNVDTSSLDINLEISLDQNTDKVNPKDPFAVITPIYGPESKKLEAEFEFKTTVDDLREIYVNQIVEENRLFEGKKIKRKTERQTNYHIYILSETNSTDEYRDFYDTIYTCAISIVSECFSSNNEKCEPVKLVDLTKSESDMGNFKEPDDLKDIPIPICLFNLTNNDVITSITCPESFSENKKKSIVLDLYFFRPPGLKRPNKKNLNVTLTKEIKGDNLFIRETNGGICDLENSFNSFCSTDMNTTIDKEGNILSYEEEAYMEIITDELNSYSKNKITKLIDQTKNITSLKSEKYKSTLNEILSKIKPYFKKDELFSKENFEEYQNIIKKGFTSSSLKKLRERKLQLEEEEKPKAALESNILNYEGNSGIKIELNYLNNPGIGNSFIEAISKLKIEDKQKELMSSKNSSLSINKIINYLVILSEAGNNLASQLYQRINISLENMTEDISNSFTFLNSLIKYKDLSDIFDATLSLDSINRLPYSIIQETANLKNKLEQFLEHLESGGISNNIKILNDDIYGYIDVSHNIINKLFENLSELSKSLSSPKSKLTEISTYYLNNTNNSYLSLVENAERILMNFYKDEFNLIKPQVDQILNIFEEKMNNSLNKQINILNDLYEKIDNHNYTIDHSNEENIINILDNLYYIKNFFREVINKIKSKVEKEMNIKNNGYLINNYDLNSIIERNIDLINNAKEIASNLDNDTFIDTKFDEIMIKFRQNFTKILKFMNTEKENKFPLNEDVLNDNNLFSSSALNNMQTEIDNEGVNILNNIRKENEYYLKEKDRIINEFIENNTKYLNDLTLEIDSLFTETKLEELAELYETAYYSCINKTQKELENNNITAFNYFTDLVAVIQDNNQLIKLLKKYKTDKVNLLKYNPWRDLKEYNFSDTISSKNGTKGYLEKYKSFIESFLQSRDFITYQMHNDLLSEYKKVMFILRQTLQNFKNNKMSDKYPDTSDFFFIDNHIRVIDKLYNRLNNKISDEIFNSKFVKVNSDQQANFIPKLNDIDNFISNKHKIINNGEPSDDINYDFCFTFKRKICYTCVNGVVYTHIQTDDYCFPVDEKYKTLILENHSIYSDSNYKIFIKKFEEFLNPIKERIKRYTLKIDNLKQLLLNAENSAINQNYTLNYLSNIQNKVNSLMIEKYGDKLVESSYDYYQKNIKNISEPLFNIISDKWYEIFNILIQEINNNENNFKNSIEEFSTMSTIY